jgi:hypothetical protein
MTFSSLTTGRAPLADFNRWVDSLMANYKKEIERSVPVAKESSWISHTVQKEAIQNSSDALDKDSADKWCVTLEMDDNLPPKFVAIIDQGTCGLTGRAIVSKDELDEMEEKEPEKYQQERWARFEALSFPNIDPIGKGSKGQGKWTFIGASEEKTIVYDTLRKDARYRVGGWFGDKQLFQDPPEGYFAEELIKKEFGLKPLERIGTRIIIKMPKKELWEGFLPILDSPIAKYIGETWWELLKSGAVIFAKWREYIVKIGSPPYYTDDFIQKNKEETWVVNDCGLNWPKNPKARVKELVIIRSKAVIPEGFRGIAIQRGGMKIRNFDVTTENPAITPEIAESIYGWIVFNEEGEKELRTIEDTTHYDFSSSLGTFGFHVFGKNGWLIQEVRKFAEKELGLGPEDKKKSGRSDVLAVNKLNRFASKHNLGEKGRHVLPTTGKKPAKLEEEIRIKMPKPVFPHLETRRVEYGEAVTGITVSIVNDTSVLRKIKLLLTLKTVSRKGIPERVLKQFVEKELAVAAAGESETFGPFQVVFDKHKFKDGTYAVEAEIVLLEGDVLDEKFGKGMVLDQDRELIYLNEDPPTGKGLFEFIDRIPFKDFDKTLQYRVEEKDDRYRIQINILHPAYVHVEEVDALLSEHKYYNKIDFPNPLLDYEIEIGAEAIAHHDLRKEANLIRDGKAKKSFVEQRDKDEKAFFIKVMDQASRIAQEIRYEIL